MKTSAIWATTFLILAVLAGAIVLIMSGRDLSQLITVVTLIGVPAISKFLIGMDVKRVEDKVSSVEEKVNGHLSELTAKIPDANNGSV